MRRRAAGARARGRDRRRSRRTLLVLALAGLLVAIPTVSFARAMTYPGNAPTSVRAVEWVRDHGGGPLVDRIENWWYTRHRPSRNGVATDQLSQVQTATAPPNVQPTHDRVATIQLPTVRTVRPAVSGEGRWQVASRGKAGTPLLFTTFLHPDRNYPPVVAGAALIPRSRTVLHLQAGTREPVPNAADPANNRVPTSARSSLVAVFNAGFKIKDSHGGWYADGRQVYRMHDQLATLVSDSAGHASVRTWQAGTSTAGLLAARQNLHLVVDHGRPVAGLGSNAGGRWGTSRNQFQYTWRSGVGTDAAGDLIYVAGNQLTLGTLAEAMSRVGILTGMELDMHAHMVAFNLFPDPSAAASTGVRLLRSMPVPRNRYLVADQRDFFYVTAR